MPFPTVNGVSFAQAAGVVKEAFDSALEAFVPTAQRERILTALGELFDMVDLVSTQLYNDVQQLKLSANERGWPIEIEDPSQRPQ